VPGRPFATLQWPLPDTAVFASVRDAASSIASLDVWPTDRDLSSMFHESLNLGAPDLVFSSVERPKPRCVDDLYEGRIVVHRSIPMRERDAHDLLNALVWARFPRSKWALSLRLYDEQKRRLPLTFERMPPTRTRTLDLLAMIDEGSVLRHISGTYAFGHGLLEQLCRHPERAYRPLVVDVSGDSDVDADFASMLRDDAFPAETDKRSLPLAILFPAA
jgi:Protein of unknown function (DUF3025)